MAMEMDQPQSDRYYCRICRKGFGCGRALGGHMRAHGISDDVHDGDGDDEPSGFASEWDDKLSPSAGNQRMYALRTNPSRFKTCRVCENCGKEFFSWKAFLEHGNGKCASEEDANADEYSILSSPVSDFADQDDPAERRGYTGWSKGKRSRRTKVAAGNSNTVWVWPSSEEEEVANCLVMMSASRVSVADTEESSCASAHKVEDVDRRNPVERSTTIRALERSKSMPAAPSAHRGTFECKACGKVFGSHQALGGHRASHKKVKGCFAAKPDDMDEYQPDEEVATRVNYSEDTGPLAIVPFDQPAPLSMAPPPNSNNNKAKLHECSICHRVFSSGQALGGHKRCHWMTSNNSPADAASMAKRHQLRVPTQQPQLLRLGPMLEKPEPIDLNLPAPADAAAGVRSDLEVPLSLNMPSGIFLQQPWMGSDTTGNIDRKTNHDQNTNITFSLDDNVHCKIKQANLSDLKDMNMGGEKSPWLQVGIGSFTTRG